MQNLLKKNIYVAGHQGMVGSAIVRQLKVLGCQMIITMTSTELNLTDQVAVHNFFKENNIDIVFLAAAKVGGIYANNTYPAEFIYQNLMIEANIIHQAWKSNVKELLFLGSSCIYPKEVKQPMKEEALLTGILEKTNEPYAIAKIAGIKLCESYNRQYDVDYRSVMPTNLYGENDNFHSENSHVIPAMMRRFHEAKQADDKKVIIWGSGRPMREFLYVDDMAAACLHIVQLDKAVYNKNTNPMLSHINIGSGKDYSIKMLAEMMAKVVGFNGTICFDKTKPDGTQRKLMDVSRLRRLGWEYHTSLEEGLVKTYQWFLENESKLRK